MSAPGNREVAHRVFAAEFDDADLEYSESDEERAPNYVVTPSGARINRLFFVGVLTETESVNEEVLRARVVDPTGAFVVYAGQYQPDELAFLESTEPPAFVAVTGKARTFQPDDSDRTFTSVRPESITEITASDRDRWAVTAAEHTLDRVATMADALGRGERSDELRSALAADGVPAELADGVALALEHYGTNEPYLDGLRTLALDVARVVADDRDEVRSLDRAPDDPATERVDTDALTAGAPSILSSTDADETDTEATDAEAAGVAATSDTGAEPPGEETADKAASGTTETSVDAEPTDEGTGSDTGTDDLGDFEGGGIAAEEEATADDGTETADEPAQSAETPTADTDEMYEFDDEERQEIEEEYGTEFSTGAEVESPDEDVETADTEPSGEPSTESDPEATAEAADDRPVDEVLMEAMRELDDGDGAERETLVETVVERTGADADSVEDAIQDALMGGQCYEPGDDVLKPI